MVGRQLRDERRRGWRPTTRGQSEVLSIVLLLGITITGTGVVVMYGSSALSESQQTSEIGSAEHAMTQLDSKASLVGIDSTRTQTVSLGVDGTTRIENSSGQMQVTVEPLEGFDPTLWCGDPPCTVLDQSLGTVVYENGETAIAYQGGGVWKRTGNGSTMVSPPEVHYRDTTLTLPLVAVAGQGPLGGKTVITQNGTGDPKYPRATPGMRNPLTRVEVTLTVQSEYYEAWGQFFEQRTGGDVAYDHDEQTATLTLVTPPNVPEVKQGVASTSSQKLVIKGSGGTSFTDSYDSSDGGYVDGDDSGTINTVGGASLQGDAEIRGDLVSGGGEVELGSSNARIGGNLSYAGSTDLHKNAEIDGWTAANGSVAEIDPVDGMVVSMNESIHDAEGSTKVDLSDCESTCTLNAGKYYTDNITLSSGEELELNLSEGNVSLAVSGPITVNGGKIRVVQPGNNRTNVYMDASTFQVVNGANVSVPGEKSPSFRVYGPPGVDAEFSGSRFVGLLYAPDSNSQQGTVSVTSQADVYGALVGGQTTLQSGGAVHYDAALAESTTLPSDAKSAPHVTYMHVTVNRVNVTSV